MNVIEMHCLNALCDGYASIASIMPDVRRATHFNVLESEIEECVRQLVNEGLATAFAFDAEASKYVPGNIDAELSERWFSITEKGRKELDRHWVDDEPTLKHAK